MLPRFWEYPEPGLFCAKKPGLRFPAAPVMGMDYSAVMDFSAERAEFALLYREMAVTL